MDPARSPGFEARSGTRQFSFSARDRGGATIDFTPVKALLRGIVAEWEPKQIWLFGSRARGESNPASDWDLLVVVPDDCRAKLDPVASWRLRREHRVRADIVPCHKADFDEDRDTPNTLAHEAVMAGVLIYER